MSIGFRTEVRVDRHTKWLRRASLISGLDRMSSDIRLNQRILDDGELDLTVSSTVTEGVLASTFGTLLSSQGAGARRFWSLNLFRGNCPNLAVRPCSVNFASRRVADPEARPHSRRTERRHRSTGLADTGSFGPPGPANGAVFRSGVRSSLLG